MSWNGQIEQVIKNIGESSNGYKLMHVQEARDNETMYTRLMVTGIVLGPMSSILSASSAAFELTDNPWMSTIEIILGFLSGIVVAIIRFGKYDETSNAHKSAAARYASVEGNIRRQLSLNRSDRILPASYLEWVERKYEDIFTSAPLIREVTHNNFSETALKNGWSVPNQYSHVIEVNQTDHEENIKTLCDTTCIHIEDKEIDSSNSSGSPKENPPIVVEQPHIEIHSRKSKHKRTAKKGIKRSESMSKMPEINICSDKMLEYEMRRMMGK
jgi:hypothetical protein